MSSQSLSNLKSGNIFFAGIIKRLFGQLLARYLIYLARENRYWAQLTLCPISALTSQINQISDTSRPNNCILNVTLIRELHNVRYANSLPVCHSISSFDCTLDWIQYGGHNVKEVNRPINM